jgi:hypothetical protein
MICLKCDQEVIAVDQALVDLVAGDPNCLEGGRHIVGMANSKVLELTEAINRVQESVDGATQEHVRNGIGVPIGQHDLRILLDAACKWAAFTDMWGS